MTRTRDIIEAATPGPWLQHNEHADHVCLDPTTETVTNNAVAEAWYGGDEQCAADAAFIAHFDPVHVKLMEDAIEAARRVYTTARYDRGQTSAEVWGITYMTRLKLREALDALNAHRASDSQEGGDE